MITIKLDGAKRFARNAERAKRALRSINPAKQVADETLAWLVDAITTRKLNLAPLSAAWAARKDADAPTLVNTGKYIASMMVRRQAKGEFVVGVLDELQLRAMWLEYGTSRMPPRPHWRPAEDFARFEVAPRVGGGVLTSVAKELAK